MSNLKNRLKGIKNMSKKDKFWKLAVYYTDRLEGGSEEGGWYFTAGDRVKEGKTLFTDPRESFDGLVGCLIRGLARRITSSEYGLDGRCLFSRIT
jgi:hypothetical protein